MEFSIDGDIEVFFMSKLYLSFEKFFIVIAKMNFAIFLEL